MTVPNEVVARILNSVPKARNAIMIIILIILFVSDLSISFKPAPSLSIGSLSCKIEDKVHAN